MDRKAYIRVKSENGDFDLIYPITNTDNIELIDDTSGNLSRKLKMIDDGLADKVNANKLGKADGVATLGPDGLIPLSQIPIENREMRVVDNIEQLYAIEPKFTGLSVFVKDATGDVSVKSGGAFYIYDGNKFIKTAQADTMNVTVNWDNVDNKPTTLAGYGITDAINQNEKVKHAIPKNAGKLLIINEDGDLDANITGRANSTARLDIPRKISFTGDLIGDFMFDGAANVEVALKLLSKGIKPGAYTKVQVDERGQIIGVGKLTSVDMPGVDWSKVTGKPTTIKEFGITDQVMVRDKDQQMTGRLFLTKDPTDDLEAVTKHYVDNLAFSGGGGGSNVMKSVITVATENISLTGLQTLSNVEVKNGDRVLVVGQTNKTENGIYISSANTWSRAEDMDTSEDCVKGSSILIEKGLYGGRKFVLITDNVNLGTTDIEFTEVSGEGDVIAGSGLVREGNKLSLEKLGTPGTYLKVTVDQHGRVISATKFITESDIIGGVTWSNINEAPLSPVVDIDDAVVKKHKHVNPSVLDNLSENENGNLLYKGKEIIGGGGGGTITGTLTSIGSSPSSDLAVGGMWFDTKIPTGN